jgi:hypothetical protein
VEKQSPTLQNAAAERVAGGVFGRRSAHALSRGVVR